MLAKLLNRWKRKENLQDWLPWLLPIDDEREILMTSTGGLLRCVKLDLPDFETASPEALEAHHDRLTNAIARFGSNWSIWLDQWRTRSSSYLPECDFGGIEACRRIDDSRRRHYTNLGRFVATNSNFLSIHLVPNQRDAFLNWVMDHPDKGATASINFFRENSDNLLQEISHSMRGLTVLRGDELASYLSATVTYEAKPTFFPAGVISRGLATREWKTTGRLLQIDDRHIATVEIRNYGSPSPITMEPLHELDFECRWVVTAHGLDPDARRSEIKEVRKSWAIKQRGLSAIIEGAIARDRNAGRTNPDVDRALIELDAMAADLDRQPFALVHANVHVWGDTEAQAAERAAIVAGKLKGRGYDARVATLNFVYGPLGDMPGNVGRDLKNIRQSRENIGTITRVAPTTGVSTGHREDWRFGGSALMVGTTRRGVPLYWALNPPGSDKAHTGIVGATGAGKSVLIGFMAAQFMRYPGARVTLFDRGRSFMVGCHAMGGDWVELGGGGVGVQPLRAIHLPEEMSWAHGWVSKALQVQGLPKRTHTDQAVMDALNHVRELPPDERTLSALHTYLSGDEQARQALTIFLDGRGAPFGKLFDGVVASYGEAPVMGIETSNILGLEHAAPLVIAAMFRAVRRDRLTGSAPKMLIVDEAWSLLQSDLFAGEIESWAREMRKLNTALVLATQDMGDLTTERAQVIFNQLGNRVYLPHAEAMRSDSLELYKRAGLQEEHVRVLASALPKAEYLLQTDELVRLISVHLEDDALALLAAASPADHMRAQWLLAQGIEPGQQFTERFLSQTTAEWTNSQRLTLAA